MPDESLRYFHSAFKWGIDEATIRYVLDTQIYRALEREDPPKVKVLGIDSQMQPIELVYVIDEDGSKIIIHAMRATQAFLNQARRARKETR